MLFPLGPMVSPNLTSHTLSEVLLASALEPPALGVLVFLSAIWLGRDSAVLWRCWFDPQSTTEPMAWPQPNLSTT